ncbi:organic cation/carnitine transporter 2-like [Hibiscus syriacus]|uniref:Organic cation/carnitine transporter 2-like n=1 Tax=Hibiscus syriacus TaxID=106335 RepID=A0A6A3AP25_HIBSY|nr:organic cation/carnitine transporter 2-like [Hibiscus syriacus]
MADSTPLLSDSDKPPETKLPPRSLDETIERCIGGLGGSKSFKQYSSRLPGSLTLSRLSSVYSPMPSLRGTAPMNRFAAVSPTFANSPRIHGLGIGQRTHRLYRNGAMSVPPLSSQGCPPLLSSWDAYPEIHQWVWPRNNWNLCPGVINRACGKTVARPGRCYRVLLFYFRVPVITIHFLVRESPRWLFVKGRKEEAVTTLKSMAQTASALTMSFSNVLIEQESGDEYDNVDIYSSIRILFNKRWAAQRLAAVMVTSFGIGMVYYGMPLGLGNLSVNLYLGERVIVGFHNLKRCMQCNVCGDGPVWPSLQIAMELISFFSACAAFNMSLIYTLELFPTCVRNSAISMVRQALVFRDGDRDLWAAIDRITGDERRHNL